ncbi:MAG: BspA family leucine-rich repeat surface protein [Bacteroidales bacterium]|nr:BspA family leucine-rich repeat surface protein [Bacteroidales bacterium]
MSKNHIVIITCVLAILLVIFIININWKYAYVVKSEDGTTLTFYYDNHKNSRQGTVYKINNEPYEDIYWLKCDSSDNLNYTKVVFDNSFKDARPMSCARWFSGLNHLTTIEGIQNLNTSDVEDMYGMFQGCSNLTCLDLRWFNTHKVTNMCRMFYGCSNLTDINLKGFKVGHIDISSMFQGCYNLESLDLSDFDIVGKNARRLFFGCYKLKYIIVSKSWEITDSSNEMFYGCDNLCGERGTECIPYADGGQYARIDRGKNNPGYFTLKGEQPYIPNTNVSNQQPYAVLENGVLFFRCDNNKPETSFNIGRFSIPWLLLAGNFTKVVFEKSFADYKPTTLRYMFEGCSHLMEITGLENLNTSDVVDMCRMFFDCSSLKTLDLRGFNTTNVTNTRSIFENCSSLESLELNDFNTENDTSMVKMFFNCCNLKYLNISNFNTKNVNYMQSMFQNCSNLTNIDVSHFDTKNVEDMNCMFENCNSLLSLDVSNFDTENVHHMAGLFKNCSNLTILDVSHFDTKNVEDMNCMFENCSSLLSLDVSNFNTESVKDMGGMFENCSSLTSLDVSGFNTEGVYWSMTCMFKNCTNLKSLDLSSFDTKDVDYMREMFCGCKELTTLDLSSFDTHRVLRMEKMFAECTKLKTIYVSDKWSINRVDIGRDAEMFLGCTNLIGGEGTIYNPDIINKNYARIDGGKDIPGYFTKKK